MEATRIQEEALIRSSRQDAEIGTKQETKNLMSDWDMVLAPAAEHGWKKPARRNGKVLGHVGNPGDLKEETSGDPVSLVRQREE